MTIMKMLKKLLRDTKLVYTRKAKLRENLVIVGMVGLVLLTIALLHPGVRPRWDRSYRQQLFATFLTDLHASGLDPQAFWLFRERFSPGTFTINPEAVGIFQTFRVTDLSADETWLLAYKGSYIDSTDSIVPTASLSAYIQVDNEYLYVSDQVALKWQDTDKKIQLVFILPISEMKKANGFFDYLPEEMTLLEDKYWLNQTELKLQ